MTKQNFYYVKDHLGSTRMTVYDDNAGTFGVAEATMYYSYGNMEDELSSSDVTREKFTGKEFDTEGAGAEGIGAFHFPARMYDPEVGVWMGRDPAGQFFNAYAYTLNPVNNVDPDGEWVAAVIAAASWYIGNLISYGTWDPLGWNWDDPRLYANTVTAAYGIGMDLANDFAKLADRNNTVTFEEDGSQPNYSEMESRKPTDQEENIIKNFYENDEKYMEAVRSDWDNMNKAQGIKSLREGIQDYDLKGIPGKDVNSNSYKLGPPPYKDDNGNLIFKATTTEHAKYRDHIHSQRISRFPSGKDFSNVKWGDNYYLLHNPAPSLPLSGKPSVIQYGTKGFWIFKTNYIQSIKISF